MSIEILRGDATAPIGEGNKIIIHICNDIGAWGKGFVLAVSKKWREPELAYKNWYKPSLFYQSDATISYQGLKGTENDNSQEFKLGNVQFVKVSDDTWVANMIAQHGIRNSQTKIPPIRYEALEICLEKVRLFAKEINASVHMPRIGCGLAGGKWNIIQGIIANQLTAHYIVSMVYDFE